MQHQVFETFYKNTFEQIEKNIIKFNLVQSEEINPVIHKGIQRLCRLNCGGKRLRGTLVYIGYRMACDRKLSEADALATAFELFQTAILVHDDVFDHSDIRRGMETIHTGYFREFKENSTLFDEKNAFDTSCSIAICLGDMSFYFVEELMLESYSQNPACYKLLSYFHKTVINTIKGEILDIYLPYAERYENKIEIEKKYKNVSLEDLIYDIYHMKTSFYTVIGPLCSGLILGGASDDLLKHMESIADDLGLAFQMQDDILGIYGDQKNLGKNIGSDISEYKQTLLFSYIKEQGGIAYEKLNKYYGKENITESELIEVQKIFRDYGALEYVEKNISRLFNEANDKLRAIEISEEKKQLLYGFIDYLQAREG